MTAREPDPINPKPCPICKQPGREATPYEQERTRHPYLCDPCNLAYEGTATEFQRYRVAESLAAAERMATNPKENRP